MFQLKGIAVFQLKGIAVLQLKGIAVFQVRWTPTSRMTFRPRLSGYTKANSSLALIRFAAGWTCTSQSRMVKA